MRATLHHLPTTIPALAQLAALLTACSTASGPAPARSPAPQAASASGAEASPPEAPDLREHMQLTFWLAVDARDALIDGDLQRTKELANELATRDYGETMPADWKHWIGQMQQHAEAVALAADMADAAQGIAKLGVSCGNCHLQQKQGPEHIRSQEEATQPQQAESVDERMERHDLAADLLWMGLSKPSETAWERGTVTLTRAPLEPPVTTSGEAVDARFASDVESLRQLARDARAATSLDERAQHYGKFLATCADCHHRARVGFRDR
ncbi:MAG: hypothetical protein OEZ06_14200 [Myxococcales bacterium]|nr:hypothetical protein [Myxococcales bacterium]